MNSPLYAALQAWSANLDKLAALVISGSGSKVVRVNAGATNFELATVTSGTANAAAVFDLRGQTVGSTYLRRRDVLKLAPRRTFSTARTIATNNTAEYGWSKRNCTSLASGDENTTTASASYMVLSTATDRTGGAQTNPDRYQVIVWDGRPVTIIQRAYSNGSASFNGFGGFIARSASGGNFFKWACGYDGTPASVCVGVRTSAANATTNISAPQRDAGAWLKLRLVPTSTLGTAALEAYYSVLDQATPPSDWSSIGGSILTASMTPGQSLDIGEEIQNVSGVAGLAGGSKYFSIQFGDDDPIPAPAFFNAEQFLAAPAGQRIGSVLIGSSATVDTTSLRNALASVENTEFGDSATITWSVVRGVVDAAEGSYAASGSVTVSGTGDYLTIYVKIASASGTAVGSIALPVTVPVAA